MRTTTAIARFMPASCRSHNFLCFSHLEILLLGNPEHAVRNVGQSRPNSELRWWYRPPVRLGKRFVFGPDQARSKL